MNKVLLSDSVKKTADIDEIIGSILCDDTVLLIDGADEVLLINTKGWQMRSIDEPSAERVIRGPREGFVESIITNISLIRRKIKSPDLKFMFKEIGKITKTKVSLFLIHPFLSLEQWDIQRGRM